MTQEAPEIQQQRQTLRTDIPRSAFGEIIIFDEFKTKQTGSRDTEERTLPLARLTLSVFETMGFDKPEIILQLWFGKQEIDESIERELISTSQEANAAMSQIFGPSFLKTKTTSTKGSLEIKDIYDITELAKIATSMPIDAISLARAHQALIKITFMHIINSIKRGYEQPKVEAIAKNLIQDIKRTCEREESPTPIMEEVFFQPYSEELEFSKEIPEGDKKEKRRWKRGFRLNILADPDGTVSKRQPILYIDETGKSESSVLLKCLNKNIDHLASGILDIERMRIEFPPNTLESMSQEERDDAIAVVARLLQNIVGTNLIAEEGRDEFRGNPLNNSASTGVQKRIKFGLTYRPNITYKTVLGIAEEIRSAVNSSAIVRNLSPRNITIPQPRRSEFIARLNTAIQEREKEIRRIEKENQTKITKRTAISTIKQEISEIKKVLNLLEQAKSIIPTDDYDVIIGETEITTTGNRNAIQRLQGVPLEVQIVDHLSWREEASDHNRYIDRKNDKIAKELGLAKKPYGTDKVTSLTEYIRELATIITDEKYDETILRAGKPITLRQHAKRLLSALLINHENHNAIQEAIALTQQSTRDAILETISDNEIEEMMKRTALECYEIAVRWAIPNAD